MALNVLFKFHIMVYYRLEQEMGKQEAQVTCINVTFTLLRQSVYRGVSPFSLRVINMDTSFHHKHRAPPSPHLPPALTDEKRRGHLLQLEAHTLRYQVVGSKSLQIWFLR